LTRMMNEIRAWLLGVAVLLAGVHASEAQLAARQTWGGLSGGSANAQTLTIPNVTNISDLVGVPIRFVAQFTNTGAMTLTINSLAPVTVLTRRGQHHAPDVRSQLEQHESDTRRVLRFPGGVAGRGGSAILNRGLILLRHKRNRVAGGRGVD
jgi:hypothetical protein